MANLRISEIAKQENMSSKELIAKLTEAGITGKTASSKIDDEEVHKILHPAPVAEEPKVKRTMFVVKKRAALDKIKAEDEIEEQSQPQPESKQPMVAESAPVDEAPEVAAPVSIENEPVAAVTAMPEEKELPAEENMVKEAKHESAAQTKAPIEHGQKEEAANTAVNTVSDNEPPAVTATVQNNPKTEEKKAAAEVPAAKQEVAAPVVEKAAPAEVIKTPVQQPVVTSAAVQAPGSKVIRVIERDKLMERLSPKNNNRMGQRPGQGNNGNARPGFNQGDRRPGANGNYQGQDRRPSGTGTGYQNDRHNNFSSRSAGPTMSLDDMAKAQQALSPVTEINFREQRRRASEYDRQNHDRMSYDDEGTGRFSGRRQQFNQRELLDMRERENMPTRLRKKKVHKAVAHTQITEVKESKRVIKIEDRITVGDLAQRLGIKAAQIIKQLMGLGMMATANEYIDFDTATLVAEEYSYRVENVSTTEEELLDIVTDAPEDLQPRAPVVTVMGHVDHGKTSILDAIRRSDVAKHEHGGITQHIGAYSVETPNGRVAFIDTPGHAAFTAMRARGAQVTDIVVLVVAADDGVMPQTIEAINHAQAAKVPIIVAVNKCDVAGANPDRVMQALTEYNLLSEEWGGDTIFVKTAAVKGQGIPELLENILLQAEMLELTANPNKAASGTVIEAELDKGRGPVATILVQDGTLKIGDYVIAGSAYGKVRALVDARGARLKEAGPSVPVEIQGLGSVPAPGDNVNVVESLDKAKELAEMRLAKVKEEAEKKAAPASLEDLLAKMGENGKKELKILVKTDVQGSMEALKSTLGSQSNDEVEVKVIHAAVGAITESDIILAAASQAIVVGFNVRPDAKAAALAESEHVDVKTYRVIYDVLDDVQAAMNGMLRPVITEKVLGRAQVVQTFKVPKVGTIAGSKVLNGKITRSASVRLLRDNVVVFEGKICSLRHFKDDVREVLSGHECGIGIENYQDIHLGDVIEAFTMEETSAVAE